MPGPHHQWLYLRNGDYLQEIVNGARTAAYLTALGGPTGIDLCSILEFAGCEHYLRVPAYVDSADVTIESVYSCETPFPELEFSTPAADPAPWWNDYRPESEDAYGFYIEEWTGLDARHVTRASTPVGGAGSGIRFGPAAASGRVQKFNILLLAGNEKAMQYLFDWLSDTLIGSCSACATDYLLYKRWCETNGFGEAIGADVGEQRRVALVEGLQWENDLEGVGQCLIRRASFTLTAGDPCIYGLGEPVSQVIDAPSLASCISGAPFDPGRLPCRPSCSELSFTCADIRYGDLDNITDGNYVAPIIALDNNYDTESLPIRITVYSNPNEVSPTSPDNWCGLPVLGQIYVAPLPAYSQLTWDVPGRRILYRDITTGDFVESSAFLLANDPPIPRWFMIPCPGNWIIVMEIGDLCMTEDSGDLDWPAGGLEFTDPHYPDMDLLGMVGRTSCP